MIWVALAVRFLLELGLLAGYGYWAAHTIDGSWRWPVAIALPLAVAVVWGLFLSPKAPHAPPVWGQLSLEAALFGGALVALWSADAGLVGLIGFAVWALDRLAIAVLGGMPPH